MPKIKLVLEYDGTDFFGFQVQGSRRTIQGVLEKTLHQILQEPIRVIASGRTDSGVHASAQVVHFVTKSSMAPSRLLSALNGELPKDISIASADVAHKNFHARFSVKSKTYRYQVWNSRQRSALNRRFVYQVFDSLNFSQMKKAARIFVGRHNFASFQASRADQKGGTIRTIQKFKLTKKGALLTFDVQADGFLYNMVRSLVGTVLMVGKGRMSLQEVKKLLQVKDRRRAGPTVPPQGLTLIKVDY